MFLLPPPPPPHTHTHCYQHFDRTSEHFDKTTNTLKHRAVSINKRNPVLNCARAACRGDWPKPTFIFMTRAKEQKARRESTTRGTTEAKAFPRWNLPSLVLQRETLDISLNIDSSRERREPSGARCIRHSLSLLEEL